ncbi:MAG TPA: ElyC/SanA/YdcF family protein [Vicinamibacterales bacterium]|nr:ElyC/SanA/YdcF family protein [Vicinamibacterales bacterium]
MLGLRRFARRNFATGIVCGVLLVFAARYAINQTTFADWLVSPLLWNDTAGKADAIVVLGAGVVGDCGNNLNGVRRVLLAARLYREGRAPRVMFTGGPAEVSCPVAVAMAQLAADVGIPASRTIVETASHSTRENASRSTPVLRGLGARRLLLVTDRLHMRRAAESFTRMGFDVDVASVPVYEGHADNVSMLYWGGREMLALTYYNLRGWLGPGVAAAAPGVPPPVASDAPIATAGAANDVSKEPKPTANAVAAKNPDGPLVILGASYAGSWTVETIAGIPVVNRGVAGQQSFEVLERFERDVVPSSPRAVILWGFINDIFRADADVDTALGRARESYEKMVAMSRAQGIEPILATEVTVRPPDAWSERAASLIGALMGKVSYQDRINRHVIDVNRWMADFAAKEGLLLLDFQAVLADDSGRRRREFIQDDGSHLTAAAYRAVTEYATPILEEHFSAR